MTAAHARWNYPPGGRDGGRRRSSLAGEARQALREATPDGFELVKASARMSSGTTLLAAAGEFSRGDGAKGIEAPDIEPMRAAVPEGWTLLRVRRG